MTATLARQADRFATIRTAYGACPLCDSTRLRHVGAASTTGYVNWHDRLPPTLDWMRCDDCTHVFTQYHWTEAGLAEVFHKAHAGQVAGGDPDHKRQVWKPVVRNALDLLGGYGAVMTPGAQPTWLDVGCGDGALVMTAAEFGFAALGLDARQEPVAALQRLGYAAAQSEFLAARSETPVTVVSMFDVLEHMVFPRKALAHAHDLLAPGGLLVISLPNMDSSSWRLMDQSGANPYWMEIEHHHNFTRASLTAQLVANGFEVALFDIPGRYKAQMELYARKRA
jgi:protein O-GlcNAc transferase